MDDDASFMCVLWYPDIQSRPRDYHLVTPSHDQLARSACYRKANEIQYLTGFSLSPISYHTLTADGQPLLGVDLGPTSIRDHGLIKRLVSLSPSLPHITTTSASWNNHTTFLPTWIAGTRWMGSRRLWGLEFPTGQSWTLRRCQTWNSQTCWSCWSCKSCKWSPMYPPQ